jgi:hypothetical protein
LIGARAAPCHHLVPISVIDNVWKPILMAQGLSTPMLVILVGSSSRG